jgi:hypothetical protein
MQAMALGLAGGPWGDLRRLSLILTEKMVSVREIETGWETRSGMTVRSTVGKFQAIDSAGLDCPTALFTA